jgi:uncharacterized phage protein (TIGR01671 family)
MGIRKIIFRGKRLDNGEWVYGSLAETHGELFIGISTDPDNPVYMMDWHEVDPDTVGQFTGLFDKNGKEIYEGDVLLLNTTGLREHCIVEWNSEKAGWCISLKVAGKWALGVRTLGAWMNEADFCIQGNIYDNPELLNEK